MISKNNYEEYFLLYTDNELSDVEKNMVENFVKRHPEVEEEFLMISQSVLKPDNELKLEDKNSLFRHASQFVNHSNYQEVFVLYNDNELTNSERNQTEVFLLENPSLRNEFELLQRTRLQPDKAIVFPDKNLLFRSDAGAKVVRFKWWRAVAAAVILSVGLWIGIGLQHKHILEQPVTIKNTITKKPVLINPLPADTLEHQHLNIVAEKITVNRLSKGKKLIQKKSDKILGKPSVTNNQVVIIKRQTNNLPQTDDEADKTGNELNVSAKQDKKHINNDDVRRNVSSESKANNEEQKDEIANVENHKVQGAYSTSYTANESENNNNYVFYNITEQKFNKSKVGGFLRKVKRIIERKISPLSGSKNDKEVTAN